MSPARPRPAVALAVLACVVLAARLLLIAGYGSATPISDQWAQEGGLYNDFLTGHLGWQRLLASHYEHRVLLTRLLDLLELVLNNGVWNPLLQMVVNALLYVAALVLLLALLRPACPASRWPWLTGFAALLAVLPFDDENTLNGFQSQIDFVLLFSVVFLFCLSRARPLSACWWGGLACGLLAWLSHGAGTGTLLAGAGFLLLRPSVTARERAALAVVGLLALVALVTTPPAQEEHAVTLVAGAPQEIVFTPRAGTPGEFLHALWQVASWPSPWLAPLFYLPLGWRLFSLLRQPPRPGSADSFVLALLLWAVVMLAMMAYGRARAPLLSRYTDFYALGLLLSFFCLLQDGAGGEGADAGVPWRAGGWVALLLVFLLRYTNAEFSALQTLYWPQLEAQGQDIRAYLESGNVAWLERKEYPQLPAIPTAAELHHLLAYPALRSVLPPPIVPANAWRQAGWVRLLLAELRPLAFLLLTAAMAVLLWQWPEPRHKPGGQ